MKRELSDYSITELLNAIERKGGDLSKHISSELFQAIEKKTNDFIAQSIKNLIPPFANLNINPKAVLNYQDQEEHFRLFVQKEIEKSLKNYKEK